MDLNTDETEEKDLALHMLSVFVDELGSAYAPYVHATAEIFLAYTNYFANDGIR